MSEIPSTDEALERLLQCRHHDPHSILGAHPGPAGMLFRCLRPDAVEVTVSVPGQGPFALRLADPRGLWEGSPSWLDAGPGVQVRARYAKGPDWVNVDPYGFLPCVGEMDVHLLGEGRHWNAYEKLGGHPKVQQGMKGVAFLLWAPGASGVAVVGDFNAWDGRLHPMRSLGGGGLWELFVPGLADGALYKYEIHPNGGGAPLIKTDPCAQATEVPPSTAGRVYTSDYRWRDEAFLAQREARQAQRAPLSVYEVHLGSWRTMPEEGGRSLTYRELAPLLSAYCLDLGFTHVEMMPVMEHPYGPSWGYQVGSYFAPTARWGSPDDFRFLVDSLHQAGLGVILDWVPAHFPRDAYALGRFTGEAVYEHADPRQGEHPDWGTYIFNYGRDEVANFLIANALYWLKEFHADGLRIDAVASMLYLDYSRNSGEWIPNYFGGRENLEALDFIKLLNVEAHAQVPGCLMIAEESTAWPSVSRPVYAGGLGFGFKWNMGWMHDTLDYFSKDPIHRQYHHHDLTFGLLYAWSENFILPLSHDEVVHGKGSLWDKMPGDRWQKAANLRSLYGYMWAHPGKKMLFMGQEFGQVGEWRHDQSLDWHLLQYPEHKGLKRLVKDLNAVYRDHPALWDLDGEPGGFEWLDANSAQANITAFVRRAADLAQASVVVVGNFSPLPRTYRVGLPRGGMWKELLNTDLEIYAGGGLSNKELHAEALPWQNQPFSVELTLPPLAVLWLRKV
ncbi:MAG TPA: 1,4-alpha-glucan branching protein GlgB [bacterium]|jgi:1,4-alpha-glucan branching enzyme|nr:1,4-alpha-glucan branching protein GlgB [bacterium]